MKKLAIIIISLSVITAVITVSSMSSLFNFRKHAPMMGTTEMGSEDMAVSSSGSMGMMRAPGMWPQPDQGLGEPDRIYEQFANYQLVVNSVPDYLRQQREYILSQEGRVLSYSQGRGEDTRYGYITAAVPVDRFDQVTEQIVSHAAEVIGENMSLSDVTGQGVQLENERERLEQQLFELELQLEQNTDAALNRRLEQQIAAVERQLQTIADQESGLVERVSYGTLTVSVADHEKYFNPDARGSLLDELKAAFGSLRDAGYVIGVLLIWVVVYAIIWIPVVFGSRWAWRKYRNRQ
ncbi:MAG: DUF4349 domain-containing protein [Patescibacteria group bacterium]